MKKTLRLVKKFLIYFSAFLVVVIIAAGIILKVVVTKDFVATQIENNINGRVEIKDISVPLWAAFSGITVEGFKIGNKDAEMKKPMEERTPMAEAQTVIGFKEFNFRVAIGRLITSLGDELKLQSLMLVEPKAIIVIDENGNNNLVPLLLKKPDPSETTEIEKETEAPESEPEEQAATTDEEPAKPFSFKDINTVIDMSKIGMEGGYFTVRLKQFGNDIIISNANFILHDILINPENLENENQVLLRTTADIALKENSGGSVQSFLIKLRANGSIKPVNPQTGQISENLALKLGLEKGTFFTGLAVFDKIKQHAANFQKAGIDISFLQDRLELTQDAAMTVIYGAGTVTLKEPPVMTTADLMIRMKAEDFINIKTLNHNLSGDMLLAEKHTAPVKENVKKAIAAGVSSLVSAAPAQVKPQLEASLKSDTLTEQFLAPAIDKSTGRIRFSFISQKNLASPDVRLTAPVLPSLKDLASKAMGDIEGALKAMVDRELNKLKMQAMSEVNKAKEELDEKKTAAVAEVNEKKAAAEARAKAEAEQAKKEAEEKAKREAEEKAKKEAAGKIGGKLPF